MGPTTTNGGVEYNNNDNNDGDGYKKKKIEKTRPGPDYPSSIRL